MNLYAMRLKELNQVEGKTVWDSIDRPIRPLIYELNRIGLKTKFSCCGFSYDNEEEPKSHAKYPFVIVRLEPECIVTFFKVVTCVVQAGWYVIPYNGSQEWHISCNPAPATEHFYRDGMNSIHAYESPLLSIRNLAELLAKIQSIEGPVTIEDGNAHSSYALLGGEWQVKPKPSVELTPDLKPI
jgi:hypothetical protein